ncbi:MAG: ATP-binding protein [Pyrinomonadaceae bacterium]
MEKRRILIVDDDDSSRHALEQALSALGHETTISGSRNEALARQDFQEFDVVVSDLVDDTEAESVFDSATYNVESVSSAAVPSSDQSPPISIVKAFKIDVGTGNYFRHTYDSEELRRIVEEILQCHLRYSVEPRELPFTHEKVEFELPSDIALMGGVLQYLLERVARRGVIQPEQSNLFVALDEAFVNAVKHGNRYDHTKFVRITAELSADEARFTVEDEGEGFDVADVPDPCDPQNLFRTSGRGVLLICHIMDEVKYNARGNQLTMKVKRPNEGLLQTKTFDSPAHHSNNADTELPAD